MLSSIVSRVGLKNFSFAETLIDRTFDDASEQWRDAIPAEPEAWLFSRCTSNLLCLDESGMVPLNGLRLSEVAVHDIFDEQDSRKLQLQFLFSCCDPSLTDRARLLLVLHSVCGLTVPELSVAMGLREDAVDRTLQEGRTVIESVSGLMMPTDFANLGVVHHTLYLMFNEGCIMDDGQSVRRDFCIEAMRLTRSIVEDHVVRNHDTFALFALMCIRASRFDSRIGTGGDLLELELQDRSRWDRELIQVGVEYLKHAHASNTVTRYILEGAIASVHGVAEQYEETNWNVLAGLYTRLSDVNPSPINDLSRCVAMIYTSGAVKALEFIQSSAHVEWLRNYYLYYVVMGKIYLNLGRTPQAVMAYEKALSLSTLRAEQDYLHRKILTIQTHLN